MKPQNEKTQDQIAMLRLALAYMHPRPMRQATALNLLGLCESIMTNSVLSCMEDVYYDDGEIGLVDNWAERYKERLERNTIVYSESV
jgi:hypothetical protein